jgi:hypothetical protein
MRTNTQVRVALHIEEGQDEPLKVVRGIAEGLRNIDGILREWIARAREQGHSWQQIADVLNVSRQSAWERYRDVEMTPEEAIGSVIGSLADYPGPTTDEMRRMAREEEAELEDLGKTP